MQYNASLYQIGRHGSGNKWIDLGVYFRGKFNISWFIGCGYVFYFPLLENPIG